METLNLLTDYLTEKQSIAAAIEDLHVTSSWQWYQRYSRFATNLGLAFPDFSARQQMLHFKRFVLNRQLCFLDEQYSDAVICRSDGAPGVPGMTSPPAVIATFHTGSYRLLIHRLVKAGIPVTLPVSRAVRQRQEADYRAILRSSLLPADALQVIEAEHPSAGLQLTRAIRGGRTVVGYLDGNLGSGVGTHLLSVPFFATRLRVRTGLAWLAAKAGVPFTGVICTRQSDGAINWETLPFGSHTMRENPAVFSESCTRKMYERLCSVLSKEPWQWDQWPYLHESFSEIARK